MQGLNPVIIVGVIIYKMPCFTIFFALLASTIATPVNGKLEKWNSAGKPSDISKTPYQVSLQLKNKHICGASIISDRFILTGAWCVRGNQHNWNKLHVRVGSTFNDNGGQFIKVKNCSFHPDYDGYTFENDIAVLELETPIAFDSNAHTVDLPSYNSGVPIGDYGVATGWEWATGIGEITNELHSIEFSVQDPRLCEEDQIPDFNRTVMVCGGILKPGICWGDAGGPLVVNGVQYGIVTTSVNCGEPNGHMIFAHVANLRDYIARIAGF